MPLDATARVKESLLMLEQTEEPLASYEVLNGSAASLVHAYRVLDLTLCLDFPSRRQVIKNSGARLLDSQPSIRSSQFVKTSVGRQDDPKG